MELKPTMEVLGQALHTSCNPFTIAISDNGTIFVLIQLNYKNNTMKNLFKTIALFFALITVSLTFAQTPGAHDAQVAEFETLVKGGKGTILDVRTPKEFAEGHIDGAVNINYFDKDFSSQVANLDKNKPVYIYCHSGGRSAKAMSIMKGAGFTTLYTLTGGYLAWKAAHK